MNALWWWIDRWRKSTAYTDMTLEQQGAYRNLIDEATLRGGAIPDDERVLAKACGDAKAWRRIKGVVLARFTRTDAGWRNDTLDEVLKQSQRRAEKQARYRDNRRGNNSGNEAGNNGGNKPGYPDPDPDPDPKEIESAPEKVADEIRRSRLRKKTHPQWHVFCGSRFCVGDRTHEQFLQRLGDRASIVDLYAWYQQTDEELMGSGEIMRIKPELWLANKFDAALRDFAA